MRFIKKICMLIYMLAVTGAGALALLIALGLVTGKEVASTIDVITGNTDYRNALLAVSGIYIIAGIVVPFRGIKKLKKVRFITFQNPDGEVAVSVSAVEDYINKVAKGIPAITNIRPKVSFSRKGIVINSNVTIAAGTNIPEITERIQMEVRSKLQTMLGIEEKINMVLHVNKVIGDVPEPETTPQEAGSDHTHIPFR